MIAGRYTTWQVVCQKHFCGGTGQLQFVARLDYVICESIDTGT